MSHTESSSTVANDTGNRGVSEKGKDGSDNPSSPDEIVRERVLKEVGLTSSTFIGPALPPETSTAKSDPEDTLSEFYKELEQIDTPDGKPDEGFVQPTIPLTPSNSKETCDASEQKIVNTSVTADTDGCQRSSGQKKPSRPHWYKNEPYPPRRPRPDQDQSSARSASPHKQRHYPEKQNRPPNTRFHQPPYPPPLPLHLLPNQQNPSSHVNQNLTGSDITNQQQEDSYLPPFTNFPPPNLCNQPPQGFHRDSPCHFDRDERVPGYSVHLEDRDFGWSTDRKEQWCHFSEDYDWRHRESEKEQQHCQHFDNTSSSLVLILMRGLPGSGKSTLARELLSTGPSGLILSTDDYFSHREGYRYDPCLLGAAHEWNQRRAEDAMHDGRSPIIIDNTNIQAWEMKPYVKMALKRGYKVDFCEPNTSWKFDPYELAKRNTHRVPQGTISQMMDRFSFPISVDIVLSSQVPPHVNQRHQPRKPRENRDVSNAYR
ncbi:uncharacterized protein n4bp2l2 [Halichoeres trimaculatus]|uniref:uncharacterized protein n4bp2l2 n=1 Tax=Halichoeres trimaculatus TaxID=147232 RepID=UPI003D9F3426